MADELNQYDTYEMTEAITLMFPPTSLFLDLFFKGKHQARSKYIQFDVYKGGRWLSPFVRSQSKGDVRENKGYDTKTFEAPYIKVLRKIDAADLLKKQFGQGIYQPANASSYVEENMAMYLREEKDGVWRTMEWMASQILQTGKVTINGKGYADWEVDFLRDADHTVAKTAITKWTESTADPIADITDWCRLVEEDSGHIANVCVMGFGAAKEFINNTKVQNLLDNRRMEIGKVKPVDYAGAGVTLSRDPDKAKADYPKKVKYVGTLSTLASGDIDLFSYTETYTDGGTSYPMLPTTKVVVGSTDAVGKKFFGAIEDLDYGAPSADGLYVAEEIFVKRNREWNPSAEFMLIQAAPLPGLIEPDSTVCAEVMD